MKLESAIFVPGVETEHEQEHAPQNAENEFQLVNEEELPVNSSYVLRERGISD